jgi:hypothetical protein
METIMNKPIQIFPPKFGSGDQTYGILETPCYPASFYFGPVHFQRNWSERIGEWMTADNATHNFHRTLELARITAKKTLKGKHEVYGI